MSGDIMISAMLMAYKLWSLNTGWGKCLSSGWGVLLPCILAPLLAIAELSVEQLRILVVIAMLTTLTLLLHHSLRGYLLLPSFVALAGSVVVMLINVDLI